MVFRVYGLIIYHIMRTTLSTLLLMMICKMCSVSATSSGYETTSGYETCSVGMSDTGMGCVCIPGHVNKTDALDGCSACPAGTFTQVITEDAGITEESMIDIIMAHFNKGEIGSNATAEEKLNMRNIMKATLSGVDNAVALRATFFQMFLSHHMCARCASDTYSNVAATQCLTCQSYSASVEGSSQCHCDTGYKLTANGVCTTCSNCTREIDFDVTIQMIDTDFVGVKQDDFREAIAHALALKTSNVIIRDVKIKVAMRRLLSAGSHTTVSTTVMVSEGALDGIVAIIRGNEIISKLAMHGIEASSVGPPKVVAKKLTDEIVPFPLWFIIGLAGAGLLVLLITAYMCVRFALRHKQKNKDFSVNRSEYIGTKNTDEVTDTAEVYNTSLQVDGFMHNLHQNHSTPEVKDVKVVSSRPKFWGL